MLYFANPVGPEVIAAMHAGELGMIDTPTQGKPQSTEAVHAGRGQWCADNSCFGPSYPGDEKWFAWLKRKAVYVDTCAFATAPDVVGDAQATLERSRPWLPEIRRLGYPAALVAQDGLEDLEVPWDEFDVLFLGGSTEWKLSAAARRLTHEALRRGKRVHMGRVNSAKRLHYAIAIGCHSADGTFLVFAPEKNLARMRRWFRRDHGLFAGGFS